jgi:hypothetical protein
MTVVPSFAPRLVRKPLSPRFNAISFVGCGQLAVFASRFTNVGARVDAWLDDETTRHELLVLVGKPLEIAHRDGSVAAQKAVAYSHAALARLSVAPAPRPPDLDVLRAHVARAEHESNELLAGRLRTVRRNVEAELASLRGEFRGTIDRSMERIDPSEHECAERAYREICAIDLEASFPTTKFEELPTITHAEVGT